MDEEEIGEVYRKHGESTKEAWSFYSEAILGKCKGF